MGLKEAGKGRYELAGGGNMGKFRAASVAIHNKEDECRKFPYGSIIVLFRAIFTLLKLL